MRIRDACKRKHSSRAVTNVTLLARARGIDASMAMVSMFLKGMKYELQELKMLQDRTNLVMGQQFDLISMEDKVCLQNFRFKKEDILRLQQICDWPDSMNTTKRKKYKTNFIFSFCLMCRRLGTANRWSTLELEFGKTLGVLNEIFYECLEYFNLNYGSLVTNFRDHFIQTRSELYADAIAKKGAPYDSCVGFIDGTHIFIARPKGANQRATYSGHKRRNGEKFQSVSLPDGIIFHLFGPLESRLHDMTLFRVSNLETALERSLLIDGRQFYIYGDSAYVLRSYLQIAYQGGALTEI